MRNRGKRADAIYQDGSINRRMLCDIIARLEAERVEIVRCRDCKNGVRRGDEIDCVGPLVQTWDYYNDEPLHNPVPPDGFCAWGVRRES